MNAEQPYTLYEALFGRLLARCQQRAPHDGFRFKNKLYAIDASTIDLCLAAFPRASFRRTKGAIKLHIGLDQAGHLPSFLSVTDGKAGDVTVARTWTFPAGSVVVADRAYLDFKWLHHLHERGVTFVTRLKRNVKYRVLRDHDVDIRTGVLSDQTIELTSARRRKAYPGTLRRVGYWDEETNRSYVFVTNNRKWVGKTIADLYKSRWQIELFFKWIKQNLKVKRFVGRSKNAVLSQLWGGDVHVPGARLPEVRPAAELDSAPDAAGSAAQPVRPPSTRGVVHAALATGFPESSDAAVVLKMWDSSGAMWTGLLRWRRSPERMIERPRRGRGAASLACCQTCVDASAIEGSFFVISFFELCCVDSVWQTLGVSAPWVSRRDVILAVTGGHRRKHTPGRRIAPGSGGVQGRVADRAMPLS